MLTLLAQNTKGSTHLFQAPKLLKLWGIFLMEWLSLHPRESHQPLFSALDAFFAYLSNRTNSNRGITTQLRILKLFFLHTSEPGVKQALLQGIERIPSSAWIPLIPQVIFCEFYVVCWCFIFIYLVICLCLYFISFVTIMYQLLRY